MRLQQFVPLAAAAILQCGAAAAATMTFDGLAQYDWPFPPEIYVESGITATVESSAGAVWWSTPGALHLDDSGTDMTSQVSFTTGQRFRAVSLDIIGLAQSGFIEVFDPKDPWQTTAVPVAYRNLVFQGFRQGEMVAQARHSTGLKGGTGTYVFAADFSNLDRLLVIEVRPDGQFVDGKPVDCIDAPCSHVDLDAITLVPVPLPGGLPLAGTAIAAIAGLSAVRTAARNPAPAQG